MKNVVSLVIVILIAATLQTTLLPLVFDRVIGRWGMEALRDSKIDLALLVIVYLSLRKNRWDALIWISAVGLFFGMYGTSWGGIQGLGYLSIALICVLVSKQILLENPFTIAIFCAALTLVEGVTHFVLGSIFLNLDGLFRDNFALLISQIIFNSMLAPVVFAFMREIDEWSGGRSRGNRNELLLDL